MPELDEQPDVVGRLLGGHTGFSNEEREALFEDIFTQVQADEPTPRARPWWAGILGLGTAAAAVALAVAVWPAPPDDAFRARGEEANLELRCTGAGGCKLSDTLTFDLSGAGDHFAAFARDESGEIIWYFPETDDGRSIVAQDGTIDRSVQLGGAHHRGTWTVHAVLSAGPLSRAEIRACFDDSGTFVCADHQLIKRELRIE